MAYQSNKRFNKFKPTYSYLNDPHLFYHLENPFKIKQLLQTGMYELQGNTIIQKETKVSLVLSQYTIDQLQYLRAKNLKNQEKSKKIQYSTLKMSESTMFDQNRATHKPQWSNSVVIESSQQHQLSRLRQRQCRESQRSTSKVALPQLKICPQRVKYFKKKIL